MISQECLEAPLDRSIAPQMHAHPDLSGVFALPEGQDAFAVRILLAEAAARTLDVQYYIWRNDMAGNLMLTALLRAAERGVRVRLLIDDYGTTALDRTLPALQVHPNIDIKIFNPFKHRWSRSYGYLTDFSRLNRRMHNKSFTADKQVTLIGGRNIGNEYYEVGKEMAFTDLDVMAIGPVVADVSNAFDRYWECASARPIAEVLPEVGEGALAKLTKSLEAVQEDADALKYLEPLAESPFVKMLLAGELPFEWAVTHMVCDDPAKGLDKAKRDGLLWPRLKEILGVPTEELELVSPYFVPGRGGMRFFSELAQSGVHTTVFTNSLEATDVPAVHAGYAKRRKRLLKAGVKLYEMKWEFSPPQVKPRRKRGSSNVSLHAKTFSVDRKRVFVGSFNFDPRSARLNTELGFVIESPALAKQIADSLARDRDSQTYRLRLSRSGKLEWVEERDGREIVHKSEPGASWWRRAQVSVLSRFPIDWLL